MKGPRDIKKDVMDIKQVVLKWTSQADVAVSSVWHRYLFMHIHMDGMARSFQEGFSQQHS